MRDFKNRFNLKISLFEKVKEGDKESLKLINSKWVKVKAKEFEESLREEEAKGISHKIEKCSSAPVKFQFNTIYLRADGKVAWVFLLKEDNSNE